LGIYERVEETGNSGPEGGRDSSTEGSFQKKRAG
jgi:hypothetical protein